MISPQKIGVAGAGSIGCFVGGMLAANGRDVALLARPRVIAEIETHGLRLTSFEGFDRQIAAGELTLSDDPVIFADALRELCTKYPDRLTVVHWLESLQGLPSTTALAKAAAGFTDRPAFICGPGPFMDAARQALESLKVPAQQVHIEVFKSLESDPFAAVTIEDTDDGPDIGKPPATAVVQLDGETHTVSWPRNAKLLDVLLAKGLDAPFSCREGHCGACACTLRSGKVNMEVNDVLEQQDLDEGLILACQSHPESDSVEVTYDE